MFRLYVGCGGTGKADDGGDGGRDQKISKYITEHRDKKILFLELGVGRLTPMFIQEPFWNLTLNFEDAFYIAVNDQYDFLPQQIEEKGFVIKADIGQTLEDAAAEMKRGTRT